MRRYSTKKMFMVLTPILLLHFFISSSSGVSLNTSEKIGVYISKGRNFQPYESQGKPPKSINLDLNLCKNFHGKKTCCSASQIHSITLSIQNLATYGEANQDCLELYKILKCSICSPNIGIQKRPFCNRVFKACSDAYFTNVINSTHQVIVPCGGSKSLICGKASKWESNGTSFCDATGFKVQLDDEEHCYGSKPVVESLRKIERFQKIVQYLENLALVKIFQILLVRLLKFFGWWP